MSSFTKWLLAIINGGWSETVSALRIARARLAPDEATINRLAIRLIARGRLEKAESLLRVGLARAPRNADLLEQFAFCAHNAARYQEALNRWRRLCTLRPDLPMSWCGIAANARELRLLDEATAAAGEALRRFPNDVIVRTEAARVKECCGAFAEAVVLWRDLLSHPSADDTWHLAMARNLMAQDRHDEAQAVLAALQASEDLDPAQAMRKMARQWCELADAVTHPDRNRFVQHAAEAVSRFGVEAARETLIEDTEAYENHVRSLLDAERLADADREVDLALRLAPEHEPFAMLKGSIAIRRQDWKAALAFAAAQAAKYPDDRAAADLLDRMRRVRQLEEAERTRDAARLVPIAPAIVDAPDIRQLMLRFESFGQDCEFGTVQRRYGAEPLGLLRWADTTVATLMAAIKARFEGVGEPGNTELFVGHVGDIQVRDKRWDLAMHTFLFESEVSMETLYPKMCRRRAYLRDKLLEDLSIGDKTLIFKTDLADMSDLLALHDELLALGPNCLLNVRLRAGPPGVMAGEPGTVQEIRPGLFVAHLSRMYDITNIAYDEWIRVCRDVEQLRAVAPWSGRSSDRPASRAEEAEPSDIST